jgi:hypothetical protein
MNTIERRVSEQLRAYGEGLDMTTQDIDRLERELEQKQHVARADRRSNVWQMAVAACAVTGVVLGALALRNDAEPPKTPGGPPALTLTDLAGTWRVDEQQNGWLWTFTEDGKLRQADSPDTLMGIGAQEAWTVIPAPGGFKTVNASDQWRTGDGTSGAGTCEVTWAATITAEGRMRAIVKEAGATCQLRAGSEAWQWTRISPASLAAATMSSNWPSSDESMVTEAAQLRGTWLLKGTSTVLSVNDSGDVFVHDLSAPEKKQAITLTLGSDGSVALPGLNGLGCTVVYRSMTTRNSTLDAEQPRGTDCGLPDTPSHTWIRLN